MPSSDFLKRDYVALSSRADIRKCFLLNESGVLRRHSGGLVQTYVDDLKVKRLQEAILRKT